MSNLGIAQVAKLGYRAKPYGVGGVSSTLATVRLKAFTVFE